MPETDSNLDPSPALKAALERAYAPPAIPATFDRGVLAHARRERTAWQRRRLVFLAAGPLAAAACLAFGVFVTLPALRPAAQPASPAGASSELAFDDRTAGPLAGGNARANSESRGLERMGKSELAADDFNGDGLVDIIDALVLARDIDGGQGRDLNADGRIDRTDIDHLAARAVKLPGGAS